MPARRTDASRCAAHKRIRGRRTSGWVERYGCSASVTFGALAAVVVGAWADDVLPVSYLYRPLAVVAVIALLAALAAHPAGRHAAVLALALGTLIVAPVLALPVLITLAAAVAAGIQGRRWDPARPVALVVVAFLVVAIFRAVAVVDLRRSGGETVTDGDAVYLVLLDGYPRIDTLATMGIDDGPFIGDLEQRGFDFYPDSTSVHGWTVLTLTALLTGEMPTDAPPTMEVKRELRATWSLPYGWLAIDPPIGHVTIPGVPHFDPGGINDLEAHLVGESLLGALAAGPARSWLARDLVAYHRTALEALATTEATRVFAHIVAPHPPFVLGSDPTAPCWPRNCDLYQTAIERTDLTSAEWRDGMATQLAGLRPLLLDAIDRILDRRPEATIVLFSDHGGRETYEDLEEWHRCFLAARTPGNPILFDGEPHPHEILRLLDQK